MSKKIPQKILRNPRYIALEMLIKIEQQQAYANLLLKNAADKAQLETNDRALLTELVYGTVSRKLYLEFCLHPFIKKAKKLDLWVKQLLLLSLYQICFLDRIPDHAVVNDAVEIAKKRGNIGIGQFVNGVLRQFLRKGAPDLEGIQDPVEKVAIEVSLPTWLVRFLNNQLSLQEIKELGLSLLEPSHASVRVNTKLISRTDALEKLELAGYEVAESKISPVGLVAKKGFLANSVLFKEGKITVQDESSMLVAPALQVKKHHRVLDACAAPGGKTTHIAQYLDKEAGGEVVALDIHPHKLKLIEDNVQRMELADVVTPTLLDARSVQEEFADETFDRILVDAPCSGLGLLRRKPDIKYSKKIEDFTNLKRIQLEILESVAKKLKVYGIMVYSTCTITEIENQEVIEQFLANHSEYEQIPVQGTEHLQKAIDKNMLKLYPHYYHTDGFFISCLRRIAK